MTENSEASPVRGTPPNVYIKKRKHTHVVEVVLQSLADTYKTCTAPKVYNIDLYIPKTQDIFYSPHPICLTQTAIHTIL